MTIYATTDFRRQVEGLAKKNNYSAILQDVCSFLSDKNIRELHLLRDIIQNAPMPTA